ncbi:ribose 5-phosphate isomerase A [Methylophilaceae bacterium]|nr:ribose 5-phosphate isomerase A [Methylophilaceae bacterium]
MEDKEIIAIKALDYVTDNSVIGLGTGSTANFFIKHLAKKIKNEQLNIKVVASSTVSEIEAIRNKLNLIGIDTLETLDLYVDGADEITNNLNVLKGRGYDLVKEKMLSQSADKFIIIADQSKRVAGIGENYPIPIEVLKSTWRLSKKILDKYGKGSLRKNAAGDAYAISSAGNYIFDYSFDAMPLRELHEKILTTPGVIETGIFYEITDCALIVDNGQIEVLSK